uniref:Hydroxymethylpyrimidine pyrophosphatase n=1 Tax=Candidatus Kentrum sp. SD TaxID=2126332 RepID=A0A450YMQ7_9GAMM|nr:MAG: Hydroxymethylpyrimidine pyrophosphatase [Candidatus Kentron sp. SD]VFK48361.1 MAG: Hydroxymethylpyrimidine pyrophosphatase [Candidatus Kentron sp. SD]
MQIYTFLFASELDGVLLPNGTRTAAAGCLERTWQLLERLKAANYPVVYIADHHLSLARESQGLFKLPEPEYWICNLGTEIHDSTGKPEEGWARAMGTPFDKKLLLDALRGNPNVTLRADEEQGPHKFSFDYSGPVDDTVRTWISTRASQVVSEKIRFIDSVEESSGLTSFDLLPAAAGKSQALGHLAEKLGLPRTRVFFSGGGEGSLDILTSGVCGTLVGNADAVQERARELAETVESARITLSRDYYGDGVIEGLRAYDLIS